MSRVLSMRHAFILLFACFFTVESVCARDPEIVRALDDEVARKAIIAKAQNVLIEHDLCANTNDCTRKRLLFFSRKKNGMHLETFTVEDANVVSALASLVISEYHSRNQEFNIDFQFYRMPHEQMMGLKKLYVKPFLNIELVGVEK